MAYRTRRNYTAAQMSELWDRWQKGETLKEVREKAGGDSRPIADGQADRVGDINQPLGSGDVPGGAGGSGGVLPKQGPAKQPPNPYARETGANKATKDHPKKRVLSLGVWLRVS